MTDSDFIDIGDELVVRVSGFPIGRARIVRFENDEAVAELIGHESLVFNLPLNVKSYDDIDGYGHGAAPLAGIPQEDHIHEE